MENTIVVMGGSFNPITNGHLSLAEQIIDLYNLDSILFLPVGDHYIKPDLLSSNHRFNMLERVVSKNEKFRLSYIEKNAKHAMNTVESLRLIQKEYPDKRIVFLMGTDNLHSLVHWDKNTELLNEFSIAVIQRGEKVNDIINQYELLQQYQSSFIPLEGIYEQNSSSTTIRGLIKKGISFRYLVPDEVHDYILQHRLYS